MGKITVAISEEAESWLRGKNRKKGDLSAYIENLILKDKNAEAK
jgi:hypothetical protein